MKKLAVIPVLFGFFVMGFVDVVGVSTNYIKDAFTLSDTLASLIPLALFVWFLLLSAPTALLMNRIGRKATVQISNVITFVAMLIPFLSYNFVSFMIAFALLGIGNTMIQVALNPLLTNVVKTESLSSYLTAGQVIKAISAFCAPYIALAFVTNLGPDKWYFIFPAFAIITLISAAWLFFTKIEEAPVEGGSSIAATFGILKNKYILYCFIGILTVVGLDVGMNVATPKLLLERCPSIDVAHAGLGSSVYFLCRTCGSLLGVVFLAKMSDVKYFRINILLVAVATALLFFAEGQLFILVLVGAIGFFAASVFSIIMSLAIKALPSKTNEISGVMITGVCGGGFVNLFMGMAADWFGSQIGSLLIISVCVVYLVLCAFPLLKIRNA